LFESFDTSPGAEPAEPREQQAQQPEFSFFPAALQQPPRAGAQASALAAVLSIPVPAARGPRQRRSAGQALPRATQEGGT
jgi:hypothetical protein